MDADREAIPDDIAALKEALAVERAKALEVEAELAIARAKAAERQRADRSAEAAFPEHLPRERVVKKHPTHRDYLQQQLRFDHAPVTSPDLLPAGWT